MDLESKYTRVEYERRFLISDRTNWESLVEPYAKRFDDKYIAGTRLRLRVLTDLDTGRRVIKLTKKSESTSPYFRTISRILLNDAEYELFDSLPGHRLTKIRNYHNYAGRIFSIDVFERELEGLILGETEAEDLDDLMLVKPPNYSIQEVTEDAFFDGGNLSQISQSELLDKLNELKM
jgi:CYTH domain-containing protein